MIEFRLAENCDTDILIPFIQALYEHESLLFDEAKTRQALILLIDNQDLGEAWLIFHEANITGYLILILGYSLEYHGKKYLLG